MKKNIFERISNGDVGGFAKELKERLDAVGIDVYAEKEFSEEESETLMAIVKELTPKYFGDA